MQPAYVNLCAYAHSNSIDEQSVSAALPQRGSWPLVSINRNSQTAGTLRSLAALKLGRGVRYRLYDIERIEAEAAIGDSK